MLAKDIEPGDVIILDELALEVKNTYPIGPNVKIIVNGDFELLAGNSEEIEVAK